MGEQVSKPSKGPQKKKPPAQRGVGPVRYIHDKHGRMIFIPVAPHVLSELDHRYTVPKEIYASRPPPPSRVGQVIMD